jgi:predicted HicB family RNase H-like nuclease
MKDILEYKAYYASIHYSSEDEVFYGKLIGINDSITFEGTSVAELKKSFHEAVDDYLETCRELGKEPEKMYKGSFNIRIPAHLHKQAALQAASQNMSLNDFVRLAIDYTLKRAPDIGSYQILLALLTIIPALAAGFS